jgi:hypothetical protein
MTEQKLSGAHRLRVLARYAALPLPPERESLVAAILDTWLPAADELSRKMSAATHQSLVPVTVLTHPGEGAEERP